MTAAPVRRRPGRALAGAPRLPHFIDGGWTSPSTDTYFDDRDPWTGEVLYSVPAGAAEDAQYAIAAAAGALPSWASAPPGERQRLMLAAADVVEGRRFGLTAALAAETGAGAYFAATQVDYAVSLLRQVAALAYLPLGVAMPSDLPGTTASAMRRPVGVVGAIAPWNASLVLSVRAIAGPLALGNTVVLKPSEESPFTGGLLWGEIFQEVGLPSGVLNVVTDAPGQAGAIGEELISHPAVRRLNFTGSTATGRRLAESAGRHLKRMVLQLGAHNPLVVLAGVDLAYAADVAAFGAFVHQGELCMCERRIYVEEAIGGVKDSGWGRFGSSQAIEEFTELRWITSREERRTFPF